LSRFFGVAFRGERLSPLNWLGVALVACGALLVAFQRRIRRDTVRNIAELK
jgi:transporter family protein